MLIDRIWPPGEQGAEQFARHSWRGSLALTSWLPTPGSYTEWGF